MIRTATLVVFGAAAWAQLPVAPSPEPVGDPKGEVWQDLNIRQSFETGIRLLSTDGNRDKYRSDVNFRNGLRLLSSKVEVHSRNGRGKWVDEVIFTTLGLGNDPYQHAALRVEKNQLYRYELSWRENQYFNPALTIAGGRHRADTSRRLQDHTLTLFPTSRVKVLAGYSRNVQTGPALTTQNLFDLHRGTEFTFFENVRRQQDAYSLGAEARFAGFKLIAWRNWEFFKDDTEAAAANPAAEDPASATTVRQFRVAQPVRGTAPGWRVNLFTEKVRWVALNGRFTYVGGERNFLFDESAIGTNRLGAARNQQVIVTGNARRPVLAANGNITLFPASRFTVTNHTAFTNTRMDGPSTYQQFDNRTLDLTFSSLEFLGVRLVSNTTDAQVQVLRWLSFHGGYHYASRRIVSRRDEFEAIQNNRLNAGQFGIRLRGLKGFSANFDGELGRDNNPFYPTAPRNYHALGARLEYKQKTFRLMAQARSNYSFNFVSAWSHSARSRQYGVDGSWTPRSWFSVDAGYSKIHLDTLTGLAYWLGRNLNEADSSWYVSNLHMVHGGVRLSLKQRADLFVGWSWTEDTGGPARPVAGAFLTPAQSYPFTFNSPMVRFSLPFRGNIRWNLGYQHYGYSESFLPVQNYQARTAFTSLLWSF